ncbi:MAG: hypothetical protein GXP25_03115 [Planctomycetes bacterium]|nr:hypothetical protein [Planctomycetota bacterium]
MDIQRMMLLTAIALLCARPAVGMADEATFGFESDKDGNGVPDGWTVAKGTPEKAVAMDRAVKKSGESALRLDDASEWDYVVVAGWADVKPNTKYRLKAWSKSQKTTGPTCIYISEYHASGRGRGLLKLHVLIMEQPRDWKEFEKEFTTTEKTGRIKIELCPVGFAIMHTGTVWIDDVKIEEIK